MSTDSLDGLGTKGGRERESKVLYIQKALFLIFPLIANGQGRIGIRAYGFHRGMPSAALFKAMTRCRKDQKV
jgi:hypothetical protein